MNIKKIVISAFAGVSMLTAFVGTAPAAQIDLNIYGASAQYLYWNATAPTILANQGCTNIQQAKYDSANAITKATCGSDTIYYRVSSKASFDGILSMLGDDSMATAGATKEKCSAGDPGDPGAVLRPYYRKMANESLCTWGSTTNPGACTGLKCERIVLGVSDVAGESFQQSSSGQLNGPAGGGSIDRAFFGIDASTLTHYNPIVVPFAFYVNNNVKIDPTYTTAYNPANAQTITNMPRIAAVMIFSGQMKKWKDFGDNYVDLPVWACMRHAGSGTHATLDLAVMNSPWGGNLLTAESAASIAHPNYPNVWFNDGSGAEMVCVNTVPGAVGYADADQALGSYGNVSRLTYMGELPTRVNIRNCKYEFWTKEWAYEDPNGPTYSATHPHVTAMMTYAAQPGNIPTASVWGVDKSQVWASSGEMKCSKPTDFNFPYFSGASNPQLP